MLEAVGASAVEVRYPEQLGMIGGLIIPGGETTTLSKLMRSYGLFEELQKHIIQGLPVWGTCAGAILLAKEVTGKNPPEALNVMDITADRNAYGRQTASFVADVCIEIGDHESKIQGVFIRSPKIQPLTTENVYVIGRVDDQPVLIQQDNMLASSFHPELTQDTSLHRAFVQMAERAS